MAAQIRFSKAKEKYKDKDTYAYSADIAKLRDMIRENGNKTTLEEIEIRHPQENKEIRMIICLSYEPNTNAAPVNHSIDAMGFQNSNGTWHFNDLGSEFYYLRHYFPDPGLNGSYSSLGYDYNLPTITDADLLTSVKIIGEYRGSYIPEPVKTGIARLIIAINEATRFRLIEENIAEILGSTKTFSPSRNLIMSWNGHTLGK